MADIQPCFQELVNNFHQCQYEFNSIVLNWISCAYSACDSVYSGGTDDNILCSQFISSYENIVFNLQAEAQIMSTYGCYGWISMPFKWNVNMILHGGYKEANFENCEQFLVMNYVKCYQPKTSTDIDYINKCKDICNRITWLDSYDYTNCHTRIEENYNMLMSSDGDTAYYNAQNYGCSTCNENGSCDVNENYSTCPQDCPPPNPCNNNWSCEPSNGETTENCPQDCPPTNPCNNNWSCEPSNGEDYINCPNDCQAPMTCNNNWMCEDGESHSNCPTDCSNSWALWVSTYNSALQIYSGYGIADFGTCFPNLESCFKGCEPYQTSSWYDCGNNLRSCMYDMCVNNYGSGISFDGCVNFAENAKGIVQGAEGSSAYNQGRMVGCSQTTNCNNNNICESENGENTENCPQDCRPSNPCNNDLTCQSWNGETTENCPQDCPPFNPCNNNWSCETSIGETYENCPQDCPPNPCNNNWSCESWNGETYENCPQDCPPPNPCNNNWSCETSIGETHENCPQDCPNEGGGEPQCNNNGICEEGEIQETCTSDCPWGCNNNGVCQVENGEDERSCPTDCKKNEGSDDFSTMTWTSYWNTAFTVQQGFGYLANWYSCLSDMETCWSSSCGISFEGCITPFVPCGRGTCSGYSSELRRECTETVTMISSNIQNDQQALFAYQSAQNQACGFGRRLNKNQSTKHLRR
jgi:hypothetical protein